MFQQSVEKSCKYLGLTTKAFTFEELRRISHEPKKVFDAIFNSDTFTAVNENQDYNTFKGLFSDADMNKRCDGAYYYIEEEFKNSTLNNRLYSEQVENSLAVAPLRSL